MKALEERILRDGQVRPVNIFKVDSFLNHQIDIAFMNEMGKEFRRVFARDHRNHDGRLFDLPGAELKLPASVLSQPKPYKTARTLKRRLFPHITKLPASVLHQSNRIILPIGVASSSGRYFKFSSVSAENLLVPLPARPSEISEIGNL